MNTKSAILRFSNKPKNRLASKKEDKENVSPTLKPIKKI